MSNTASGNLFFADKTYSFETIRMLAHVYVRSSDFGEVISTVGRVEEGNGREWFEQWTRTADYLEDTAEKFLSEGHTVSARDTFIRASNYRRDADFFLHDSPEHIQITIDSSNKAVKCFQKAMKFFPGRMDFVEVPYENTTLPTYFWSSSESEGPASTLIVHSGFDGTAEEVLFWFGQHARERNYNVIAFEGPGQGSVLRNKKLIFRHDWEKVVSPIIDYYIDAPEVDPKRIGLLGQSIGGYLAPRAAAFDSRISACVADDGVFDLNAALRRMMNWQASSDEEWDRIAYEKITQDQALRWWIIDGMWKFGAKSPSEILKVTSEYNLASCVKNIRCPTLVMKGAEDHMFPGQPEQLYAQLNCPKDYLAFNNEFGAGEHTHVGAIGLSNAYIFNWLDSRLGNRS
jgi:pimeloyl-ACP methyl ester carboxylesterase